MSERAWGIRAILRGAGKWLWWWTVEDTRERLRSPWRRVRNAVPKATAMFIERLLGFWSALLLTALLGVVTSKMFRAPVWASRVPGLIETAPKVVLVVSVIGLYLTLAAGLLLFALLTVTGLRFLIWLQNVILSQWDRRTAPFEEDEGEDGWSLEPAPAHSREAAKQRAKDQAVWGLAILFTIVTALLITEQEAPNQLDNALTAPILTAIGRTLDTTLLGIDFGSVLAMTAPNMTQTDFVLFILILGLPGILYLFAARNLLYFFETGIRERLIQIRDDGLRTRQAFIIGFFTLYFVAATILGVYQIMTGG